MEILKNKYDLELVKGTIKSVGVDLPCPTDVFVAPKSTIVIDFGIVVKPSTDTSFVMLVPRSSLFLKTGLMAGNSVGIIDPDYCGENDTIKGVFYNTKDYGVTIKKGTRIVQLIELTFLNQENLTAVKWISGENRDGLGSTGDF